VDWLREFTIAGMQIELEGDWSQDWMGVIPGMQIDTAEKYKLKFKQVSSSPRDSGEEKLA
jgi:hypothetical protein